MSHWEKIFVQQETKTRQPVASWTADKRRAHWCHLGHW